MKHSMYDLLDETSVSVYKNLAAKYGHRVLFQPPHHPDCQATGTLPLLFIYHRFLMVRIYLGDREATRSIEEDITLHNRDDWPRECEV